MNQWVGLVGFAVGVVAAISGMLVGAYIQDQASRRRDGR
jgi:hypothetical protein